MSSSTRRNRRHYRDAETERSLPVHRLEIGSDDMSVLRRALAVHVVREVRAVPDHDVMV
jgi:hypothetical protein